MADQNPNILAIYNSLCTQQDSLSAKIQTITDPAQASTIATEIQEIAHRIILAQNFLFLADSPQLTNPISAVKAASQDLTKAIAQSQDATTIINSVSKYLTYVDQAIDLAKTLAAAA